MSFTDYTTKPGNNHPHHAIELTQFITSETKAKEFSEKLAAYPQYELNSGGRHGLTVLASAALHGNVDLIDHIVKLDKSLLYVQDYSGRSPLHCACEKETGFFAARKLIQLGTPVNIISKTNGAESETPLDTALHKKGTNIAHMLLRMGGKTQTMSDTPEYEAAKKEMMTKQEKLFKMGLQNQFPKDVLNYILQISART